MTDNDEHITREEAVPPWMPPVPLKPFLFQPTMDELEWLRQNIRGCADDEDMRRRILAVQAAAYKEYPYPSIYTFDIIKPNIRRHPAYDAVVAAGHGDPTARFLEIGCMIGTDARALAADGYPAAQITGADLRPAYLALGEMLYGPPPNGMHFIQGDIFDDFAVLPGSAAHIYASSFFHLFDAPTQKALAIRLAALLRPQPGATIFGRQPAGSRVAGPIQDDLLGRNRFAHSPDSFAVLWANVFAQFDRKARIEVHTQFEEDGRMSLLEEWPMYWSVVRVA